MIFVDFYGNTNFEKACIDQILDTLVELNNRGLKMFSRPYFRVEDEAKRVSSSNHLSRSMTKAIKWPVHPVKAQISLGILPVWSVFDVCSMGS